MILPANEILKARKDMAEIISQFISQHQFKICTLTDIVFEQNEPLVKIDAFLGRYKSYGTVINNIDIKLNCDHALCLVRRKEFIRIKKRLMNDPQYSIRRVNIIAVEKKYFKDIIDQYQVVEDELNIDKGISDLISGIKGVVRG